MLIDNAAVEKLKNKLDLLPAKEFGTASEMAQRYADRAGNIFGEDPLTCARKWVGALQEIIDAELIPKTHPFFSGASDKEYAL